MHLADGRGRDRRLVELEEELVDREPELLFDDLLRLLEGERRDLVLERLQLEDDVRRDDVRPRREELAELDEGRAELVEHLAQARWPRGEPSDSTSTSAPRRERTNGRESKT